MHIRSSIAAVALLSVAAAACSQAAATPTPTEPVAGTVEIVGVDYGFDNVPASVPAGTELTFRNASSEEAHEMVVFKIEDDRSLEEILQLPEEEGMQAMRFVGVAVAMPDEDGQTVDGSLVLEEPGRYALVCFLPTGGDPHVIGDAMDDPEGEPEISGGPPHFVEGMFAELTVV